MPESYGRCTNHLCDGQRGGCFTGWCTCGCHSKATSPAVEWDAALEVLDAHARREVPVWQHKFIAYDDLDECGACGLRSDEECHL